jgi:fluoride exporter
VRRLLAIAAGGAVGALLRTAFVLAFPTDPGALPRTILAENVTGAFALGLVVSVLLVRWPAAEHVHAFLTTGVIGSFTTFSAVSVDLVLLVDEGAVAVAVVYAAVSLVAGMVAAAVGLALGRRLAGEGPS